jgi:putative salt-induced outer membrane protein
MRILVLILAATLALQADELVMKNGDKLSGKILTFDGKVVTLKSDYAGVVTITWNAVAGVTSTQPLNVAVQGGQVVVGTVTTVDDKFTVQTATAGPVTEPRGAVQTIRNQEEQTAYEAHEALYKHPRLVDLWVGNLTLGFARAQGSSKTTNLNISASGVRATERDKTSVYFTSLFATDGTSGKRLTTANSNRGGFEYALNVTPRFFVYAGSDFESDQFQFLDLRFVPGGGVGYHVIKNDNTLFDVFGGGNYNKEYYFDNVTRSFGEVQFGEEVLHKFSKITNLHEKLTFFPNLSDTGNYRMNFDISMDTKLRKWFAWQVAVSNRYISNPLPGTTKNNLIITTGVNLTLAK